MNALHFRWFTVVASAVAGALLAMGSTGIGAAAAIGAELPPTAQATGSTSATGWRQPVDDRTALTSPCADFLVVGVRGSGESDGFGGTVQKAVDEVTRSLPGVRDGRTVYVDYPAAPVLSMVQDVTSGLQPTSAPYWSSIRLGTTYLTDLLSDSSVRCPAEKWILVGYSQGALVVHRALASFADVTRYAGVMLIADPARRSPEVGRTYGDAQPGWGISQDLNFPGDTRPVPSVLAPVVSSLCIARDLVCDLSNNQSDLWVWNDLAYLKFGAELHGQYTSDQRALIPEGMAPIVSRAAAISFPATTGLQLADGSDGRFAAQAERFTLGADDAAWTFDVTEARRSGRYSVTTSTRLCINDSSCVDIDASGSIGGRVPEGTFALPVLLTSANGVTVRGSISTVYGSKGAACLAASQSVRIASSNGSAVVEPGETVGFELVGAGEILSRGRVVWRFGDGQTGTGRFASVSYSSESERSVRATFLSTDRSCRFEATMNVVVARFGGGLTPSWQPDTEKTIPAGSTWYLPAPVTLKRGAVLHVGAGVTIKVATGISDAIVLDGGALYLDGTADAPIRWTTAEDESSGALFSRDAYVGWIDAVGFPLPPQPEGLPDLMRRTSYMPGTMMWSGVVAKEDSVFQAAHVDAVHGSRLVDAQMRSHVSLTNTRVSGAATTWRTGDAIISADRVDLLTVRDSEFSGDGVNRVVAASGVGDVRLRGLRLTGVGTGVWLSGGVRGVVRDTAFVNVSGSEVSVDPLSSGVVVSGSRVSPGSGRVSVSGGAFGVGETRWGASDLAYDVASSNLEVPAGSSWVVGAGTVMKQSCARGWAGLSTDCSPVRVSGSVSVEGSADRPVVWTGSGDDSRGGDSDHNGDTPNYYGAVLGFDVPAGGQVRVSHLEALQVAKLASVRGGRFDLADSAVQYVNGVSYRPDGRMGSLWASEGAVVSVSGSTFTGGDPISASGAETQVSVTDSTLRDVGTGVWLSGGVRGVVRDTAFVNVSGSGVVAQDSDLTAAENWWGSADGPAPGGRGAKAVASGSARLVTSPWCSTAVCDKFAGPASFATSPVPRALGTPTVGAVLTGVVGSWAPRPTLSYQWSRNGTAIEGATDKTYVVKPEDTGASLTFSVRGVRPGYASMTMQSAPLYIPTAPRTFDLAPTPRVPGTPAVGSTLTGAVGNWSPKPTTTSYQWNRNGVPITGATSKSYTIVAADAGKTLTFTVTAAKDGYSTTSLTSAGVTVPDAPKAFDASPTPRIVGTLIVGQQVTGAVGTWTPRPTFAYQWNRNGTPIPGATAKTYTPTAEDAGATLTFSVTGSATGYAPTTVVSAGRVVPLGWTDGRGG